MNASLAWLRALAPGIEADPDALAERLASLGFPVDGLEALGEGLQDILVARVVEAGRHPNADRLSLCRVDAGQGELHPVVCGAPNVRAGGVYPFIPVGGVLPGGMKIRKAKIRGETSYGMLCSAKELGLGSDHSGILELRGEPEIGSAFVDAYGLAGDVRMDVEITANRGDLLSQRGLARELAPDGVAGIELPAIPGAPPVDYTATTDVSSVTVDGVEVAIDEPALCRRFLGAVVRGVQVGPSPDWLQARLRAVGARPINNVVDATNYVLFELGQPTHAYDLGRLRGSRVVARRAAEGEAIRTLDGEDRTLDASMLVIADGEGAVNVAGIMGDEHSGVSDETTDVFVECAHFDPRSIRKTKKALGIVSDAGYRYERFVDPGVQEEAFRRVLEVILATAGGALHPVAADVHADPWRTPVVTLRSSRVEKLLGLPFDAETIASLLAPLGFEVDTSAGSEALAVRVPGWRGYDVTREVDLIEEIARRHGFDRFPDTVGPYRPTTVPDDPLFQLEDALRSALASRGLFEAHTPAFVPESEGDARLSNPLSQEEPVLRRDLLPSLLRRLERNLAHGVRDVRLFEVGTSFRRAASGCPPTEQPRIAAVLTGRRAPEHWSQPDAPLDLWDLKGLMQDVLAVARPGALIEAGDQDGMRLAAGRAFRVVDGDSVVGWGGEVSSQAVDLPPWAGAILAFELALPEQPETGATPVARALPAFPAVERDVAVLVDHGVPAERLFAVARDAAGSLLEAVDLFDLYEGEGVPEGRRSLAYRFRFRSPERTLTDEEVERSFRSVLDRFAEEPGVQIRG